MSMASKIAVLFSGLFLLSGMLTGVWKYQRTMRSPEHRAPAYVDIAHRASFFYSFACLVIAALIQFSPFGSSLSLFIVLLPVAFFALTVAGYVSEGIRNRTDNMFAERTFITTWFMFALIIGEIGGFLLILGGFVYTQFGG